MILNRIRIPLTRLCSIATVRSSSTASKLEAIRNGPGLEKFLVVGKNVPRPTAEQIHHPYIPANTDLGRGRKVFFEIYGCQMNNSDSEIVWSILQSSNYQRTETLDQANVILLVTCSIREGAEQRIWTRLRQLAAMKRDLAKHDLQIGVLGCMAERLKTDVLEREKIVDVVAGPDSYRDLPRLLHLTESSDQRAVNVLLSLDETYGDVTPVRLNSDSVSAFVSIMRGCDNMCSYCIVPWTRGRERSRAVDSIRREVEHLAGQNVKEITLLGQNVNSFNDRSEEAADGSSQNYNQRTGFSTVYKPKANGVRFGELLERIAKDHPEMRIRFTSPHPKDFPNDVIETIQRHPNICKSLHIPIQSGNTRVLERMRRGYSREAYLDLVRDVRGLIPGIALSSDFIVGFCDETEEEFQDTLSVMEEVKYHMAYMFAYSMREKTTAHRRYKDNVPADAKQERLQRLIRVYRRNVEEIYRAYVGRVELLLIEGTSKRSVDDLYGRNDGNVKVIVPRIYNGPQGQPLELAPGDFVATRIVDGNSQVLKGVPLSKTTISEFYNTKRWKLAGDE